jgi:hypothetical protein
MKPSLPHGIGFVYVVTNPDFSSVKIGFTTRLVEARVGKDFQTAAPKPYGISYRRLISRARQVEHRAHQLLNDCRVRGEWFEVSAEVARIAVDQAVAEVEGVITWERRGPIKLRFDPALEKQSTPLLSLSEGDNLLLLRQHSWASSSEIHDVWYAHSTGDLVELRPARGREDVFGMSEPDELRTLDTMPFVDESGQVHSLALNGREILVPGDRLIWVSQLPTGQAHCAIFDTEDHVQVTSRTAEPRFNAEDRGMLLNDLPHHAVEVPAEVGRLVRAALKGHSPRTLPGDTPFFP